MQSTVASAYWKACLHARGLGRARGYQPDASSDEWNVDPNQLWLDLSSELSTAPMSNLFSCLSFAMKREKKNGKKTEHEMIRFVFLRPGCSGVDAKSETLDLCFELGTSHLILISEKGLTTPFQEFVRNQKYRMAEQYPDKPPLTMEVLRLESLQFDPTVNFEFPIVRKLDSDEVKELAPIELTQLPRVSPEDPMCIWFGFQNGDVLVACHKSDLERPDFLLVGPPK